MNWQQRRLLNDRTKGSSEDRERGGRDLHRKVWEGEPLASGCSGRMEGWRLCSCLQISPHLSGMIQLRPGAAVPFLCLAWPVFRHAVAASSLLGGSLPAFLSPAANPSVSNSMTTLTDKAKLCLADQWADIVTQLGPASTLFRSVRYPGSCPSHAASGAAFCSVYIATLLIRQTFCFALSADPSDPLLHALRALSWMACVAGLPPPSAAVIVATAPPERREPLFAHVIRHLHGATRG